MKKNALGVILALILFVAAGCTLVIGDNNSMATEVTSSVEGIEANL